MRKSKFLFLSLLLVLLSSSSGFAQRVIRSSGGVIWFIDSATADTVKIDVTGSTFRITNVEAVFEITSMTTAQRDALTASNGMIINNTTVGQIQGYMNGVWTNLGAGAGGGETNTTSHPAVSGTNYRIVQDKSGVDFPHKNILEGTNITIDSTSTTITINSSVSQLTQ